MQECSDLANWQKVNVGHAGVGPDAGRVALAVVAVLGSVRLDDDAIAAAMDRAVTRLRANRGHPLRVTTRPSPAAAVAVDGANLICPGLDRS